VGLGSLLWAVALVALFLQVVVYLAHAATVLPYQFDLDQGEGYDLNAGWLLAQGRPIYTDNASFPYFSSNYPPLYSLLVALATGIWGPTLLAGRMVSLLATIGLGLLIFGASRRQGGTAGALVAAGLFFLSNYVYHVTPLARVNALTAFFALAGLLALGRRGRGLLVTGAVLLLAAVYTKPTAVDAVAAGLLYLWLVDRRQALVMGGALAAAGLALAGLLEVSTRGAFSLNVIQGNVNPFIPAQLRDYLVNFAGLHALVLLLAGVETAAAFKEGRLDPVHFFWGTGLLMALGVGKWGAGESYFLSAIVAASILAGRAVGPLASGRGLVPTLVSLLLIVQCGFSAHGAVVSWLPFLEDRGIQARALAREPSFADLERGQGIVTRLREGPEPVLSEDPGFVLAAGKEVVGNATHLRNLHQAGLWEPEPLVTELAARRYHTVVLDAELYPEPVLTAIGRNYFLYDTVEVYQAIQKVFLPGAS
jgi:hypothetical protein